MTGSSADQGDAANYPNLTDEAFQRLTTYLKEQGVVLVPEKNMRRYEQKFGKTDTHELLLVSQAPAILRVSDVVSPFAFALTLLRLCFLCYPTVQTGSQHALLPTFTVNTVVAMPTVSRRVVLLLVLSCCA